MWTCPECSALFYFKDPDAPANTCDFCKRTHNRQKEEDPIMRRMKNGEAIIRANRDNRRISVQIILDPKGHVLENSGILATVTNEIHDVVRRHFNAHEITVLKYENPIFTGASKSKDPVKAMKK